MAKDTRRRLEALARSMEPRMRELFLATIRRVKQQAKLTTLANAIEAGDAEAIVRVLGLRPDTFEDMVRHVERAFRAGGQYTMDSVPATVLDPDAGVALSIQFGGSNPRAQERVALQARNFLTDLLAGQRQLVDDALAAGIQRGAGTYEVARDLVGRIGATGRRTGGLVGLTPADARRVLSVRQGLAAGDTQVMRRYLTYEARHRGYDKTVLRALETGKRLSRQQVKRISDHLNNRYLFERGKRIAQTEMIDAVGAGRHEGVQQLIDRGTVDAEFVVRSWDATGDRRTREDHLEMERTQKDVPWGQPFVAPDGSRLMHPADRSLGADASQTINCRCYERVDIDWIGMQQRREALAA